MFKTRNTTMLLVAAGVLLLAGGALGFVSWFIAQYGNALERDLQQFNDQEARQQEYLALERELAETETARAELASLVLDGDEDTVTFLSEIDRAAEELGLVLVTEQLEAQVNKDAPFDTLVSTFRFEGRETAVFTMLRLLESWPYHGYVRTVEVNRPSDRLPLQAETSAVVTVAVTIKKK